jgi:hypothetical protein
MLKHPESVREKGLLNFLLYELREMLPIVIITSRNIGLMLLKVLKQI